MSTRRCRKMSKRNVKMYMQYNVKETQKYQWKDFNRYKKECLLSNTRFDGTDRVGTQYLSRNLRQLIFDSYIRLYLKYHSILLKARQYLCQPKI